jgi:hypothetical protein
LGPRPISFMVRLGVGTVGQSFRISRPLRARGYPGIVRREGRVCPLWVVLLISEGRMAHRLCTRRAFVAWYDRVIDGKCRRTHRSYQQRRGGKHGYYPLYSTQYTLLTSFPSRGVYARWGGYGSMRERPGHPEGCPGPVLGRHGSCPLANFLERRKTEVQLRSSSVPRTPANGPPSAGVDDH